MYAWSKDSQKYMACNVSEVGQDNAKEEVNILNQILSTFKFIE